MDESTSRQLLLIRELAEVLRNAGVRWWLFGGWAMDAHAGRVTRDHADIETFVCFEDASAVRDALVAAGFAAPTPLHHDEAQPFLKSGVELGAWFLDQRSDGSWQLRGRWADFPVTSGSLDGPPANLDGMEVPAMTALGLLNMKTVFPDHPHGGPHRPKDIADIALLRTLVR